MILASKILKLVAFLLGLFSLLFFLLCYLTLFAKIGSAITSSNIYIAIGILFLLAGLLGPFKIILSGAQLPAEIKSIIFIQAICLPIIGVSLISIALIHSIIISGGLFALIGVCFFISAYLGFYKLSSKLPDTFSMHEMLAIIKSAGVLGKKENSAANRELMYWSNGKRNGVALGNLAPNGSLFNMQDEEKKLLDYCLNNNDDSSKKALVINFASYSCPHYRKRIDQLHALMDKWSNKGIQFLTVYTAEAHPEDGWKLSGQYLADREFNGKDKDFCFYYAKNIDDRKKMATWLIEKKNFRMPIVLDNMENTLLKSYNSWPIRLYVIENNKVVYCGDQGPFGYDPVQLDSFLKQNFS